MKINLGDGFYMKDAYRSYDLVQETPVQDKESKNYGKMVEKFIGNYGDFKSLIMACLREGIHRTKAQELANLHNDMILFSARMERMLREELK